MPHWRQEAKENARLVRQTKALIEALEWIARPATSLASAKGTARAALERIKANSTEPVE